VITFQFFGVPMRIHLSFLLVAFFGLGLFEGWELVPWTLGVLIAVLLHESGHAFTARAFGASSITVTAFALGGYTTWRPTRPLGPGSRFLISAAGSAFGIAFGLPIWIIDRQGALDGLPNYLDIGLWAFMFAALIWGVLNWIPILPLDGGHMTESLLEMVWPSQASQIAKSISVVVGGGLILVAFLFEQYFLALFLGFIVLTGLRSEPSLTGPPTQPASNDGPERVEEDQAPDQARPIEPPEFPI
jgi:Zn-dependent protease